MFSCVSSRPPNENDYEKEELKEEIHEDADEKTPLQVNVSVTTGSSVC